MWINYKDNMINIDNIETISLENNGHTIVAYGHATESVYTLYNSNDTEEVKKIHSIIQNFIDITAQKEVLYL